MIGANCLDQPAALLALAKRAQLFYGSMAPDPFCLEVTINQVGPFSPTQGILNV
jgi:hypothetical protein